MYRNRQNKGITLIALVITIIVLLILAGITLSLIIGENGLIRRAKEGTEKYEIAELKEKLELKILDIDIEKRTERKGQYSERRFNRIKR